MAPADIARAKRKVFYLCLSCKACATECPSSVDVAALKAEFQYQYQKSNGVPFKTKLFAYNNRINSVLSKTPKWSNFVLSNLITSNLIKKIGGIAKERSLPKISTITLNKYYKISYNQLDKKYIKRVYLFNDEFTNHLESHIGIDAIELLTRLNYEVIILNNIESGRAFISKGLLEQAKECANKNIHLFKSVITNNTPLIGIEPSAILSFRDDYLRLADDVESAKELSKYVFLIEEFIAT